MTSGQPQERDGASWDNPERPAKWATLSWFQRFLCHIGWHTEPIDDGYGWDGGVHCGKCGANWGHS